MSKLSQYYSIFSGTPVHFLENKDFNNNMKFTQNKEGKPMLLMIMGTFCGHCKESAPMYAKFALRNVDKVMCTGLIIDSSPDEKQLSSRIKSQLVPQLEGIPAFLLFDKNGNYITMYEGPRTVEGLEEFIYK